MEVSVRKNNVAKAMNLLNKKLREDGDFRRVKERAYYKKPSTRRQERMKKAQKAFKKDLIARLGEAQEVVATRKSEKRKSKKKAWERRVRNDTLSR